MMIKKLKDEELEKTLKGFTEYDYIYSLKGGINFLINNNFLIGYKKYKIDDKDIKICYMANNNEDNIYIRKKLKLLKKLVKDNFISVVDINNKKAIKFNKHLFLFETNFNCRNKKTIMFCNDNNLLMRLKQYDNL